MSYDPIAEPNWRKSRENVVRSLENMTRQIRTPGGRSEITRYVNALLERADKPTKYIPEAVEDARHDLMVIAGVQAGDGSLEEITDTDRLNLLLDFITVDDVGDDRLVWGPVVQGEALEEHLCNQAFANNARQETVRIDSNGDLIPEKAGWERRCILAAIDEAIRKEREG